MNETNDTAVANLTRSLNNMIDENKQLRDDAAHRQALLDKHGAENNKLRDDLAQARRACEEYLETIEGHRRHVKQLEGEINSLNVDAAELHDIEAAFQAMRQPFYSDMTTLEFANWLIAQNQADAIKSSVDHDTITELKAKTADLDSIEAAIEAGEEPEPHIKRYVKLAKYMAGFRSVNQRLIDENGEAWTKVSQLTGELAAAVKLADDRLRTIHGMNAKAKGGAE